MAMSMGANDQGPMIEINTTPLIDVLLVLLIMLIITLPAMTHAIKLDMPIGGKAGEPPKAMEVAVDFDNAVVWNGEIVSGFDQLELKMREAARVVPQPHLNVRADRRSQYDSVARVLAIAQRSGLRQIAIEGTP
jgi:biopolymer transport protein ExbD